MSVTAAILLALLGLGVGAFGTIVGAGGGFILTPLLLILYPQDSAETITAIGLVAVFFNASSGSLAYARQRRIDFRSGLVFAAATLPGAIAPSARPSERHAASRMERGRLNVMKERPPDQAAAHLMRCGEARAYLGATPVPYVPKPLRSRGPCLLATSIGATDASGSG
jgi:hypothetical protein